MNRSINPVDFSAVVFLSLFGFASTAVVWMAGVPKYGFLAGLWRDFGISTLFLISLLCFSISAAVVRRAFQMGCDGRKSMLFFLIATGFPTILIAVVLTGKAIQAA
ncbi:MAG: hypothetical protein AAGB01_09855 [Cyanobacteria bacterium P01_F01_bin.42]